MSEGHCRSDYRQEGRLCLRTKGNQGKLFEQVEHWFKQAQTNNFAGIEVTYQTTESGHHRIETRQCYSVPVIALGHFRTKLVGKDCKR